MIKKYLYLAIVLQLTLIVSAQKNPKVKVEQGTLEGIILKSGIQNYRGIPYAEPPVGELRWKAPQPAKKWSGIRQAHTFGNKPMQQPIFSDMIFRAPAMSEDCLYLNVWTPANKSDEKLPVLVYFYGGGFIAGDGSENRYDGESLSEKGIVTVTLNYRLGIFGFFSHPELTKESPNHASGNYGLLDQNAALLWVKKNIAAFGGDPDKITIAGESAGSISVSAHMASPLSKDLIRGAIGQSGAMINPTLAAIPLADAEKYGSDYAQKINSTTITQLRAIPAQELLEKSSGNFNARATVDGYFLTGQPSEAFNGGYQSQIPLLVGWTSAETPYMAFMQEQYPNPENYKKRVQETYKDWSTEILKKYPGNNEKQVVESATALGSDAFIVYSTWKWAELQKSSSKKPIYVYIFSKQRPQLKSEIGNAKEDNKMPAAMKGANHASDIEYALGNLGSNTFYDWTADDYKASATMENYFANFIKTGNPNGASLPEWLPSGFDNGLNIMNIDANSKAIDEEHRDRYLLLDSYFTIKK